MLALWISQAHSMQTSGMTLSQKIKIPRDWFQTTPEHLEICSSPWHCCSHCSVTKSCPTFSDPVDCSMPSLFVLHYLPETVCSVQPLSCVWLFARPWTAEHQASLCWEFPSPTPRAWSNSCSSSWWCHPTISSSVIPFFSHLQSLPASGSFLISQLFTLGCQNIGASDSASAFAENIQVRFPLGLTGLISLSSKEVLRVLSRTAVQKHQFFGA